MFMPYARLVLALFIFNLGIVLGAGLYESRVAATHWLVQAPAGDLHWHAEAAAADDVGVRFWAFVSTVPLTLLTLANLWMALRRAEGRLRHWWLTAALLALVERVSTAAYFIPTMVGLMGAADSPEAVHAARVWLNVNYVRHALVLLAWMAAMQTFALAQTVRRRAPAYYEEHIAAEGTRRRRQA